MLRYAMLCYALGTLLVEPSARDSSRGAPPPAGPRPGATRQNSELVWLLAPPGQEGA